jgi:hypothetical protein
MCRVVLYLSTLILNRISKDMLLLSYIISFPFCFKMREVALMQTICTALWAKHSQPYQRVNV